MYLEELKEVKVEKHLHLHLYQTPPPSPSHHQKVERKEKGVNLWGALLLLYIVGLLIVGLG